MKTESSESGKQMRAVFAAAALIFAVAAQADGGPDYLPLPQRSGDVEYRTGGIGVDESQAMKADAVHHALTLLFASRIGKRDAYAAAIPVTIAKADGSVVLDTLCDGPYLLADLPPARYRVTAQYQNKTKSQTVDVVAGTHQQVVFGWVDDKQD